jgi:hypothetical protein
MTNALIGCFIWMEMKKLAIVLTIILMYRTISYRSQQ